MKHHTVDSNYQDYKSAMDFVHTLNLKNQEAWKKYSQSEEKPKDIPSNPKKFYRKNWISWPDWLGVYNNLYYYYLFIKPRTSQDYQAKQYYLKLRNSVPKEKLDANFCEGEANHFHARFFEVYLLFWIQNNTFLPKTKTKGQPDFGMQINKCKIWIEAVVSSNGTKNRLKTFNQLQKNSSHQPSNNELLIQLTTVLKEKSEKFKTYRKNHIVKNDDLSIIAVSTGAIDPIYRLSLENFNCCGPAIENVLYGKKKAHVSFSNEEPFEDIYYTTHAKLKKNKPTIELSTILFKKSSNFLPFTIFINDALPKYRLQIF